MSRPVTAVKAPVSIIAFTATVAFCAAVVLAARESMAHRLIPYGMLHLAFWNLYDALNLFLPRGLLVGAICACAWLIAKKIRGRSAGTPDRHYSLVLRFLPFRFTLSVALLCAALYAVLSLYLHQNLRSLDSPHVILVSIDDLRADHMGCYGYTRNTTPNLDAFAQENILFERCYTAEPWTLTAHMSLLTSLYPITHAVTMENPVPPAVVTLAEVLKNRGYRTIGVVNSHFLTPEVGYKQGFDHYTVRSNYSPDEPSRNAEKQNLLVGKLLEQYSRDRLFLFLHYYDVHSDFRQLPYEAPPPYDRLFTPGDSSQFEGYFKDKYGSLYLSYLNKNNILLPEDELQHIIALYDNNIAYMDACIGSLLQMLKSHGIYEDALVIITADHGEEFQEHGYMLHANPYYHDEQLRVPLLCKLPRTFHASPLQGTRVRGMVELIDVMPSVLDLLNLQSPAPMQGTSFIDIITGDGHPKEYVFGFGYKDIGQAPHLSMMVRNEQWKLLSDNGLNAGRLKLFDMKADPGEGINRVHDKPEIKKQLMAKLKETIAASEKLRLQLYREARELPGTAEKAAPGKSLFSEEQKQQLEALGYLDAGN